MTEAAQHLSPCLLAAALSLLLATGAQAATPAADLAGQATATNAPLAVHPGLQRVEHSPLGVTLWFHLENAPFPCADLPWRDPSTAVFVPKFLRPGARVAMLTHFHGHDGRIAHKIIEHQLREQVFESGRNVLLVMPQGPLLAPDSSGGKLELPGGFARFQAELLTQLRQPEVRRHLGASAIGATAQWGRVALSAHSGGYRVLGSILVQGGAPVEEVYLFDALYGDVPRFRQWLSAAASGSARILRSWFTTGAPLKLNQILVQRLREDGLLAEVEDPEGSMRWGAFCKAKHLFVHTVLKHGRVPWEFHALRDALRCSGFAKARGTPEPALGPSRKSRLLVPRPPA